MCSTSKDSVVRGHHIYKATWTPVLGEELPVLREPGNTSVGTTRESYVDHLKHTSSRFFALTLYLPHISQL